MKKNSILLKCFFTILASMAFLSTIEAQNATATTNLNVILADVVNIEIADANVNLNFTTAANYRDGVSVTKPAHLKVSSNRKYQVSVKAASGQLTGPASSTIPVNTIKVEATGTLPSDIDASATVGKNLSATDQVIIKRNVPAVQDTYDIKYTASGGNDYVGKASGTYTTVLTYTIAGS
ncbi:hypothetical protein [Chitinophaga sp. 212800010-3]|uniref:hypothetical protein n=1 Tax=unclassified Chitinophaga TaxID=2619133 RepID=UPI002DECD331|nr:hypothetical protein [Chitinophaga sp. 212800010-3]